MIGLRGQLSSGVVFLFAAIGAAFLAPIASETFSIQGSDSVVFWLLVVAIYTLILAAALTLGKIQLLRTLFDPRAAFVGQYVDTSERSGTIFVGIFSITFDVLEQFYTVEGITIDANAPERPSGSWSSTTLFFDVAGHAVRYIYTGIGEDSLEPGTPSSRLEGFAAVDFLDKSYLHGKGRFQDLDEHGLFIETTIERITPALVRRRTGKRLSKLTNYNEMKALAVSYAKSR